jgi:hypothetical protein
LDLAVKSNPTVKKNILLKFYEYCKNVEKAVIFHQGHFSPKAIIIWIKDSCEEKYIIEIL